jgi:hypothetical protein
MSKKANPIWGVITGLFGKTDVTEIATEAIKTNKKKFSMKSIRNVGGSATVVGVGGLLIYEGTAEIKLDHAVGSTLLLYGTILTIVGSIFGYFSVKAIEKVEEDDEK